MKQKHRIMLSTISIIFGFTLAATAHAREEVKCTFTIAEDPSRNIKAYEKSDTERVRRREYDRLVNSGENAYRVTVDGGYHCRIRHIENIRLNVRIDKRDVKLRPEGQIPDCSDFQIRVNCEGTGR